MTLDLHKLKSRHRVPTNCVDPVLGERFWTYWDTPEISDAEVTVLLEHFRKHCSACREQWANNSALFIICQKCKEET